jgi:hypothetical protein
VVLWKEAHRGFEPAATIFIEKSFAFSFCYMFWYLLDIIVLFGKKIITEKKDLAPSREYRSTRFICMQICAVHVHALRYCYISMDPPYKKSGWFGLRFVHNSLQQFNHYRICKVPIWLYLNRRRSCWLEEYYCIAVQCPNKRPFPVLNFIQLVYMQTSTTIW